MTEVRFAKQGLTDLGYKLFLDRYAKKMAVTPGQPPAVGTYCLGKFNGVKEICKITARSLSNQHEVEYEIVSRIDDDGQPELAGIGGYADYMSFDYPTEWDPAIMWDRVASAVAKAETDELRSDIGGKFAAILADWKFVPGGRILAAAGVDADLGYYNCFVIPSPKDSKEGIFETANIMSQIMSRGGGVGINISTLRPRYANTAKTNGRSSGAVSWSELYSFVTGLIEVGGSRRGALMLILEDWHPDIEEFIHVKRDMKRITNANISIGISDRFMQAVEDNSDWDLAFPDTTTPNYDSHWDGNMGRWVADGMPIKIYKTVRARDLWDKLIESAWASAEPGLWFKDRTNRYSNSWYFNPLIATNPCGEMPLNAWGVCCLGSINLSKFVVDNKVVDWTDLSNTIRHAVRFLDDVIDVTPYYYPENEALQKSERKIGLGTMGLAEMLLKLELAYGSEECMKFIDELYSLIAEEAYCASVELAAEKGAFPEFKPELLESKFAKKLPRTLRADIKQYGLRNVTILMQAPTGTTGTMVNTSTGIEPFYFWEWTRKGRMGEAVERVRLYDDWVTANPGKPLPSYFVTAQDLTPEEHVRVQAAIQRWVDSSISKTCNVPENYTIEQVGELYKLMYELGCKGGTVYRDNSRNEQVLNLTKPVQPAATTRKRPDSLVGRTYRKTTPAGTLYVTVNEREDGPFEVFLTVGKAGSELAAQAEALGRLISYILRLPSSDAPDERLQVVIGQLRDIGSGRALGFGPNRVASMADGIAQALQLYSVEAGYEWAAGQLEGHLPEGVDELIPVAPAGDLCPQCGNASFYKIEGCKKCFDCGYSEC